MCRGRWGVCVDYVKHAALPCQCCRSNSLFPPIALLTKIPFGLSSISSLLLSFPFASRLPPSSLLLVSFHLFSPPPRNLDIALLCSTSLDLFFAAQDAGRRK